MWEVESGVVLDPTNSDGNIELELNYLFGIIKVPTVLARVNEPPSGYDCNLYTKINDGNIEFITEKDIFADGKNSFSNCRLRVVMLINYFVEELFVDYGPRFDRDDYTKDAKQQAAQLAAKRRMEEEEMMTLQPIDANENKVGMIDDNTNLNDGFINNLRKKGMSRLEKEGILSPEAAAKKFSELGIGMFTPMGDEDQDLIDAMKGKTSSKPSKENSSGKSAADLLDSDEYRSFLKSTVGDDIDMFQSFMEGDSGSNKAVASEKTKLSSADEDMEMIERMRKKLQEPEPTKKEEVTSPITKNQPVTGTSNAKDSSKSQAAETYLSVEEGLELQRKLDSMTDEQVEAVFEKMRKSFGEKLQSELQTKIEQNKTVKGKKDLPKARPLDPTVREKYDDELSQIEAELEKLYENPLGVWKDIMQNPDDYAPNKNDDQI